MSPYNIFLLLLGLPTISFGLECYICEAQNSNRDKCVKTSVQCEEHQDACRTRIQWKQPEFWQPRSDRYHFLSKSCDQLERCEQESLGKGLRCKRDWYRDWDCVECCQGDRCNYYVTLGAGVTKLSLGLIAFITVLHTILKQMF